MPPSRPPYSKPKIRLTWIKPYTGLDFWNDPNRWANVPTTNGRLEPFWMHSGKKPVVKESAQLGRMIYLTENTLINASNTFYRKPFQFFCSRALAIQYSDKVAALVYSPEKDLYECYY